MKNITPEIEAAYEEGRRAGYADVARLKIPICMAPEPTFGIPAVFIGKGGIISADTPSSNFCTKPQGHEGDHGCDCQEGPFYVRHAWSR